MSKETIWLKLEITSIRIFLVIYMYISNLIITATCCFPVKCIVLKVVETQTACCINIPALLKVEEWGEGYVPNWTILKKYEASWYKKIEFYIKKSIPFLDIRTSFFYLKKSISWFQKIDSWYQVIGLIFYIKKSDWFFISSIFFHIKKWIFYVKNRFLISRITEYM